MPVSICDIPASGIFIIGTISALALAAGLICMVCEEWNAPARRAALRREHDIALGRDIGRQLAPHVAGMVRELAAREIEAREAHAAALRATAATWSSEAPAIERPAKRHAVRGANGRFQAAPAHFSATAH